jgi:Tfp pilus assembly protein FimT
MRLSRGISLPELLVVLGLLTIIAAVSMPYLLGAIQNSDFNSAVRQVASDARLARSLAVSKGGYYRLQMSNNSYRVEHCNPCTPPVSVSWPASSAQMGASADVISNWQDLSSLYGGVTIQSVSTVDGAIFNSTGASVGPGNYPVTPRSVSITLQKPDGTTKVIQADPAGNVKMP